MALNLFIDSNIFLSFYHMTSEDLGELKKITTLLKRRDLCLYLPEQVKQEFQKNREAKIADAMKKLRDHKFTFSFPQMCKGYAEYKKVQRRLRECAQYHKSLMDCLEKDILKEQLEADKIIESVFEAAYFIEVTDEFIVRARARRELRTPPGKSDSLGDAVNWEVLLAEVPNEEDLYLISEDRDFQSPLEADRLHPYLDKEWKNKKNSELHFYRKLSGFFRDQYPDIRLSGDLEKELSIRDLANSSNFLITHSTITKLNKYGNDFSKVQLNEIVNAVVSNNQVYRIIRDRDVREFIDQLIDGREGEIDTMALQALQALLESKSSDRNAEDRGEDDDLPF